MTFPHHDEKKEAQGSPFFMLSLPGLWRTKR